MHLYIDGFLTKISPKQIFFSFFLTCPSSPSNFNSIANNIIVQRFYNIFKHLKLTSVTRKMKIVNSLYEWNVIMIVWRNLNVQTNISTLFIGNKDLKVVKEKFHCISPPLDHDENITITSFFAIKQVIIINISILRSYGKLKLKRKIKLTPLRPNGKKTRKARFAK